MQNMETNCFCRKNFLKPKKSASETLLIVPEAASETLPNKTYYACTTNGKCESDSSEKVGLYSNQNLVKLFCHH